MLGLIVVGTAAAAADASAMVLRRVVVAVVVRLVVGVARVVHVAAWRDGPVAGLISVVHWRDD